MTIKNATISLFILINLQMPFIAPVESGIEIEPIHYVEEKLIKKPSDILLPEVKPICGCESVWDPNAEPKHFDENGDVLRGEINPHDIGGCQINLDHWGDEAKELGYDLFIEEDNYQMANWIYENYGDWPWKWSKSCWDKSNE